jgi:dihydroorotase
VNVFTSGAISKGIAGEELAPLIAEEGGVVAITDDGHCAEYRVNAPALEYARMFDLPVLTTARIIRW